MEASGITVPLSLERVQALCALSAQAMPSLSASAWHGARDLILATRRAIELAGARASLPEAAEELPDQRLHPPADPEKPPAPAEGPERWMQWLAECREQRRKDAAEASTDCLKEFEDLVAAPAPLPNPLESPFQAADDTLDRELAEATAALPEPQPGESAAQLLWRAKCEALLEAVNKRYPHSTRSIHGADYETYQLLHARDACNALDPAPPAREEPSPLTPEEAADRLRWIAQCEERGLPTMAWRAVRDQELGFKALEHPSAPPSDILPEPEYEVGQKLCQAISGSLGLLRADLRLHLGHIISAVMETPKVLDTLETSLEGVVTGAENRNECLRAINCNLTELESTIGANTACAVAQTSALRNIGGQLEAGLTGLNDKLGVSEELANHLWDKLADLTAAVENLQPIGRELATVQPVALNHLANLFDTRLIALNEHQLNQTKSLGQIACYLEVIAKRGGQ